MPPLYDLHSDHGRGVTRRVLGNLPAYRSQAAWKALQEDLRSEDLPPYPQDINTGDLVQRILVDEYMDNLTEDEVFGELADLEVAGLCSDTKGRWSMTRDGLEALNA